MDTKKLRVYLADDHKFVLTGMSRVIQSFKRVSDVQHASDGQELLMLFRKQIPDLVLLDLEMPGIDGYELAQIIIKQYPDVKVIILSMHDELGKIVKLMEMGIHGYLLKTTDIDEVERAIYEAIDKDFYQNEIVADAMRKDILYKSNENNSRTQLSNREIEVLILLCKELKAREIGESLLISEKTVHVHRRNLMLKTGAKSTIGLMRFAIKQGFLTDSNEK
jgi:two-component system response regulator DegU